jgi:hypothetical protein
MDARRNGVSTRKTCSINPSALIAARDAVAVGHARQLAANGLSMQQFSADL